MLKSVTAAEEFLRFLRKPESVIESIEDECVLKEDEALRRVSIRLKKNPLGRRTGQLYIDLLHPDYGTFVDLEVEDDPLVRKVGHLEHQAVARYLILARFVTVWVSCDGIRPHKREAFDEAMLAACAALIRIPYDGADQAAKIYDTYFDESGRIRLLDAFKGLRVDQGRARGLAILCKRLSSKYMSLVAVRVVKGVAPPIRYSYNFKLTPYRKGEARDHDGASEKKPKTRWHVRLLRAFRGLIASPSRPHSFRVHLPAAKRASHYSFRLEAADGYFVAVQEIIVDEGDKLRVLQEDDADTFRWSINTGHGRRTAAYIDDANSFRHKIYLGVQNLELPGESTSRAVLLGGFVLAGLLGFAVIGIFSMGRALDTGAVILALVSVGAFAASPTRGPGVLGYPLLSRLAPPAFGLISAVFVVWLASRDAGAAAWVPTWLLDFARTPWAIWTWAGWVPPLVGCLVVLIVLLRRRSVLKSSFATASARTYILSSRMKGEMRPKASTK